MAPQHPDRSRGLFIAFEGGEGNGKSTQARLLAAALTQAGFDTVLTREPGGTRLGAAIRALVLDPANTDLTDRAEALLFAADRAQHAAHVLHPALGAGKVVITDRYIDSSAMYQGLGRDLGVEPVRALSAFATDGLLPDLTIVLDLDVDLGRHRATATEFGAADRMEAQHRDFHRAVRAGFLQVAAAEPHRYAVIDADAPIQTVTAAVWDAVTPHLRAPSDG